MNDLHLHSVAGEVEVHYVLLPAHRNAIIGGTVQRANHRIRAHSGRLRYRSSIAQKRRSDNNNVTAMAYEQNRQRFLQAGWPRPASGR
jgi:hypothetical protein